ncbi:MAG TPA: DNA repair protein RecN [Chloroflexi bacterium]|mgnify:CR=1 FL=1|nr:DNA repair protein RecN [Chloroflexota bacterium]
MLTELRVRDFAIIDNLQLRFAPGFSVLTGETGAGKSIIIDAMELVLGGRADSTIVRSGAHRAIVEATFRLTPAQRLVIDAILEREGLEGDNADFLLLGREVRLNGRNVSRINGRAVTLALVREVTDGLVEIHGQSEHQSLMKVRQHVNLLDRYAGLEELRSALRALVEEIRGVRRELQDLIQNEQSLAHRADLLRFQIGEIEGADLDPDEEDGLLEERVRLTNAEQLAELTQETLCALEVSEGETPATLDLLGLALRSLESLVRVDPTLAPQLEIAESVNYQLEELLRSLRDYQEQIEHNPRRLQQVEERLLMIRQLERKYGSTIVDVLTYAKEAKQELDAITHSEDRIAELEAEKERLLEMLGEMAVALSLRRREAAQQLAVRVEEELRDLRMEGARFGIDFQWQQDDAGVPLRGIKRPSRFQVTSAGVEPLEKMNLGPDDCVKVAFDTSGIDRVEFVISPNPGEPLKPMARIASGGETSRLMLAIKTVLSRADETPTLIFDEIDQGIGGRIGATVGEKLWRLAVLEGEQMARYQVLCVTHLPQLAGFGDSHFRVEKQIEKTDTGDRTVTRIRRLEGEARVEELAQMLGGGDAVYQSAREILAQVDEYKATSG